MDQIDSRSHGASRSGPLDLQTIGGNSASRASSLIVFKKAAHHPTGATKRRRAGNREKDGSQTQVAPANHFHPGDHAEDVNMSLTAARSHRMRSIAVARSWRVMGRGATFNQRFRSEVRRFESRCCSPWQLPSIDSFSSLKAARACLEPLLSATGADEVIMLTGAWDHQARRESYRLIAALSERIRFAQAPWPKSRRFN